jgi:hypothetical protein
MRRLTLTTATSDPTDGFYDHVRELPDVRADLGTAHLQASAVAAELDLDDAELWEQADGIVAALSAEAYRWTEVLTGEPATRAAVLAPPVVRLRELAVAQSRLLAVLNGAMLLEQSAGPLLTVAGRSARRVRMLGGQLQRLLNSARWRGSVDEKRAMAPAIPGDG